MEKVNDIGEIVHFTAENGTCVAALVTGLFTIPPGVVNLRLFPDNPESPLTYMRMVNWGGSSNAKGTWHYRDDCLKEYLNS